MRKEYVTFVRTFSDLSEGERELFIKDLTPGKRKYDTKHVRARISPDAGKYEDLLYLRSENGTLASSPWSLSIVEELPYYVEGPPWGDLFTAMWGGQKESAS